MFATSLVILYWLFCLPDQLFNDPLATVVLDRNGALLSAAIATDEQWRMPPGDSLSPKLSAAVITFEDRRFYRHWGVDLLAVGRALRDNLRSGRVVSGASTLSMQVIRLAQGNPPRTLWRKVNEVLLATRLEWRYDKKEILQLWCDNAPFGGNVVGVEAAAWRYFGRPATELSWGEAATLAVLPNGPGLIHPGRSRERLRAKRDRLLGQLHRVGYLDQEDLELARAESLPAAPRSLPRASTHLLQRLRAFRGAGRYRTRLDGHLQARANEVVNRHLEEMESNGIHNAAALIVSVAGGEVLAYVGNGPPENRRGRRVDMITARRSPGSLLKPLLYGLALDKGTIAPRSLLADYPVSFRGFRPTNFSEEFYGAVPADAALARSLNVPFVRLLADHGIPEFHAALRGYGFDYVDRPPEHYGLSLILGGCEISLEQIAAWFTGLARQQRYFHRRQSRYQTLDWLPPAITQAEFENISDRREATAPARESGPIGAGAGHHILQALRAVSRPNERGDWTRFDSGRAVAWKTGTSFGFRDAWAVGATPEYVVATWVGNANGEGRAGLVGLRAAAPLLFKLFDELPPETGEWFETPFDDLRPTLVCRNSGCLAGPYCPVDTILGPRRVEKSAVCTYHFPVLLNEEGTHRVQHDCHATARKPTNWFQLPPRMEHYYRRNHPAYVAPPPWHPDCSEAILAEENVMAYIYPHARGSISFSNDRDGQPIPAVFRLAHRYPTTEIHWHLDDRYLGSTRDFHYQEVVAEPGLHRITVTDAAGRQLSRSFRVK